MCMQVGKESKVSSSLLAIYSARGEKNVARKWVERENKILMNDLNKREIVKTTNKKNEFESKKLSSPGKKAQK